VLVRLGSSNTGWLQAPGLAIEGHLPRLDLQDWMPWVERLSSRSAAARTSGPLHLIGIDITVDELTGGGFGLPGVHLAVSRAPGAWAVALDSSLLAGQALLPDAAGGEVRVDLTRLLWPLPAVAAGTPVTGAGALAGRPVRLSAQGIRLAAWPRLGDLAVKARLLPTPYGLRVEDLGIDSPVLGFDGRMDWQWRGGVNTHLQGHARSRNVGGLLAALGYAPSLVSPQAEADVDLSWPAAPEVMQPGSLEGRLSVTVERGRLLSVSTSTSASRIFGWFDIDNLRRRFKGDFSDVLRRGLSFDKAVLSGPVQDGVMAPAAFSVDGPTLKAEGRGSLDLGLHRMDQEFTVTVPVTSAVPLAAVALGGPLIGGAVAAAEVALQKQIDRATQLRYRVSGDWADPKVERLGAGASATDAARRAP
jgi:uncharacterized protein YhdP